MEKVPVSEIVSAVNGILLSGSGDMMVDSVSTNSKELKKGALFVPIKGDKFNGHDFIESAFEAGAVATLTAEHDAINSNRAYIKVSDTKVALQRLAAYYRSKFDVPIVGITGSVGKTSTKEMIASVLSSKFKVHKTSGNLNGQLGLPLTILGLESQHEVAVVEMGISEFDEMDVLSQIAQPSHAVMTNIGVTHIENLHSRENIFKEKFKITKYLGEKDYLFINGDDEILCKMQGSANFNVVSVGILNDCMFMARNISCENETTSFELLHNGISQTFRIPTIGEHNVYNALVAIAIGLSMGMAANEIQDGLSSFKNINMRQNIHHLGDVTLIDDTYNANPDSMKSALKVLAKIPATGKRIAVLADMLELGELSEELHREVGGVAAKLGVDVIVTVGEFAKFIADEAKNLKRDICIHSFDANKDACACLEQLICPGDCILVKGSRGMHMEEVVQNVIEHSNR